MTDFGRRTAGVLTAHAEDHENGGSDEVDVGGLSGELADDQASKAHALAGTDHTSATLAELNVKVSDANLDDSGDPRTPSGHKASHQDGGSDEISVAGLVGTTPRAILGDGVPGRCLRVSYLVIKDGSNANTLKCILSNRFNGDIIAETDNVAKGATTGNYTLDSDGYFLTIENAGLSGNVLFAEGFLNINVSGTDVHLHAYDTANNIMLTFRNPLTGGPSDMTALVDVGDIYNTILYITDA